MNLDGMVSKRVSSPYRPVRFDGEGPLAREALVHLHASRSILKVSHTKSGDAPVARVESSMALLSSAAIQHFRKSGQLSQCFNGRLIQDHPSHENHPLRWRSYRA
jgi:hypothetical protein